MSSTAGTFLRCIRGDQEYDVNIRTGDLVFPSHLPRFWTTDWKIEDRNENVLYEPALTKRPS
jgi:hypothetical protein